MGDSQASASNLLQEREKRHEKVDDLLRIRNHVAHASNRLVKTVKEISDFDDFYAVLETKSTKLKNEIESYWLELKNIPTAVMLIFCCEKSRGNGAANDYLYIQGITRLWEAGLLPVANNGKHRVLGDFHENEHLIVIENIRCIKVWGLLERESLVNCYLQFSYDLARFTFGMIPIAFDPDRMRVERKTIKYEVFMDFIPYLTERDALIAKLLYFGAPSIESALSLKIAALDMEKLEIQFEERSVSFPKHLMNDIITYLQSRINNPNGLIFVNLRGDQVERVHLSQAFMRTSSKFPGLLKITPAALLKVV